MSKKINTDFLMAYIELEASCNVMLGMRRGGVTEYINRLMGMRTAPNREEILPKLITYRNLRNKISHENGALTSLKDIERSDIRWIKDFVKSMHKRRDPVSIYIKKSKKGESAGRIKAIAVTVAIALAIAAAAFVYLKLR